MPFMGLLTLPLTGTMLNQFIDVAVAEKLAGAAYGTLLRGAGVAGKAGWL